MGKKLRMGAVLLLNTGTATCDILDTGLFSAYHVEDLSKMVALLVAFDVVDFLLYVH